METKERINKIIRKTFSLDADTPITAKTSLLELGADSLDAMTLTMEFEEEFDTTISEADIAKISTVGDIYACLGVQEKNASPASSEKDIAQTEHEAFRDYFGTCAANVNATAFNYESFKDECMQHLVSTSTKAVQSEYYFLLAWITLEHIAMEDCFDYDKSRMRFAPILKEGREYIDEALAIWPNESTYLVIKDMYALWDKDFTLASLAINKQIGASDCRDTFLTADYLQNLWEMNVYVCFKTKLSDVDISALSPREAKLWFHRVCRLNELMLFAKYNDISQPYGALWCFLADKLAQLYVKGIGCQKSNHKPFALAMSCVEKGDYWGMMMLIEHYGEQNDNTHLIDCVKALYGSGSAHARGLAESYATAFGLSTAMFDKSDEGRDKPTPDMPTPTVTERTPTSEEQTYVEVIKALFNIEDCRDVLPSVLETLRSKLGITPSRAEQLEKDTLGHQSETN